MAIIHFTDKDVMATVVAEAGVYPCEVSKVEGPKKSSSEKSVSYFVDITITSGKFEGKTRTITFNSGMNSPSLLGDMQMFPVAYMLQLFAAIEKGNASAGSRDTEELLHKPLEVEWGVATVEGRLINVINAFHPQGYSSDRPSF